VVKGGGGEKGGEMTQTLYVYMNKNKSNTIRHSGLNTRGKA
jgi:hypothetical protein